MKYIDAEKLRDEIERLKHYAEKSKMEWVNDGYNQYAFAEDCRIRSFDKLLTFIDTLEEPASDNLGEAAMNYIAPIENEEGLKVINFSGRDIKDAFIAGAEWGEKNAYKAVMKKADEVRDKRFDTDYEVKIDSAAGFDLGCVNVYREGKLVGQYVEPKEEKKLPEDLEEASKEYSESLDVELQSDSPDCFEEIIPAFKAGAEWQKEQTKKGNPIVMSVEDFQALIDSTIKRAEKEAREQMMKGAINIKVIESYNPACESNERLHGISFIYDCKNDNQYLIAGDRAKIIIVKEEEK